MEYWLSVAKACCICTKLISLVKHTTHCTVCGTLESEGCFAGHTAAIKQLFCIVFKWFNPLNTTPLQRKTNVPHG